MTWVVDFYRDDNDWRPVEEYLQSLPDKHLGKVLQIIRMLKERGPNLPYPYSRPIEGRLRELRAQYANAKYRIFYYGSKKRELILLHAFRKKTDKTPEGDKQLALERMKDHEQRH